MAATVAPAASIFAVATRVTVLDPNGFPAAGDNVFVTNQLVKATLTPVVETGDDIAIKNANGDLVAWAKHGDMPKYGTLSFELATPNPGLEQALAGGVQLNDTTVALGLPTGLTATPQATLGTLAAGVYGYRATQYNAYGESLAEAEVTATTTGSTGTVVLSGVTMAAGALGMRFYGRTPGQELLLGSMVNIGSQATSATSGTGTVTTLSVTSLTKPIPAGYTFQIAGDTNSPKIVFTTQAAAGPGATVLQVSASQSVTNTIAAAAIVPVFVDTGALTPSGALPLADMTAGPGLQVGYQMPALGSVTNPNGVSIELFEKRFINGQQATDYPYWRWAMPKVINMHTMPRDFTNANTQTVMEGQAWENVNWGSGPFGDWQFDSTKMLQRAVAGAQILPTVSAAPVSAGV